MHARTLTGLIIIYGHKEISALPEIHIGARISALQSRKSSGAIRVHT